MQLKWRPPPQGQGLRRKVRFERSSPPPLHFASLQATQWRGRNSRNVGRVFLQPSTATGQRGWNTQPEGGLIGLGTSPLVGRNSRCAATQGAGTGTADSNAWV